MLYLLRIFWNKLFGLKISIWCGLISVVSNNGCVLCFIKWGFMLWIKFLYCVKCVFAVFCRLSKFVIFVSDLCVIVNGCLLLLKLNL